MQDIPMNKHDKKPITKISGKPTPQKENNKQTLTIPGFGGEAISKVPGNEKQR